MNKVFVAQDFHWLDVVNPTASELSALGEKYGLDPTSVQDCLDPEHLPKFERFEDILFLIARSYDEQANNDADSVQELTRKVAIFIKLSRGESWVITIHRKDQLFLSKLREKWGNPAFVAPKDARGVLICDILKQIFQSFEKPVDQAIETLERLEEQIFKQSSHSIIEEGYYLKRKAFVFKRMLRMLIDSVSRLHLSEDPKAGIRAPLLHDVKEEGEAIYYYADELSENVNELLALHLALDSARTNEASHRTNEVVRVLTIFSVFFMPLNLIAGIYGMNFEFIPGLKSHEGFVVVTASMVLTTFAIYIWFRKKGWLR